MKRNNFSAFLMVGIILSIISLTSCTTSNTIISIPWYQVEVTTNPQLLKGLSEIGKISAKSNNAFWRDRRLRADLYGTGANEAIQNIKMKAAKKGAKVVYITNRTAIRPSLLESGDFSYKVKIECIMYR